METRKIIQSGPSSLSITLPSNWLIDNGIKKGDQICIENYEKSLLISPLPKTKKEKIQKEYFVKTDKIYLIKEYLNYCFLHNIEKITITVPKNLQIDEVTKLIDSFIGFSYSILGDKLIVNNLLDIDTINPKKEFESIIKLNSYIFKEMYSQKIQINNILLRLTNLKKRSIVAHASVNRILDSPLEKSRFNISLSDIISLKIKYVEIKSMIDAEIEMVKQIDYLEDVRKFESLLSKTHSLMSSIPKSIEDKTSLEYLYEKINNLLMQTNNSTEIRFLKELQNVISFLIKID